MAREDRDGKYKASSGPCDLACLRGLLIAFNFVFILGGLGVLAIGIWTVMTKMVYVALLGSVYYNMVVYLLIVAGVLVLLTGILGCIGAVQKNSSLLTCYFVFLVIIFLAEIIAGILGFIYHEAIQDELAADLKANLNRNYNQTGQESLTEAVDKMQQDFQCCGVEDYSDWKTSKFIKQNKFGLKTPESCCKSPSPLCSQRDHPSNIYRVLGADSMGCLLKLVAYLKEHIFILAITGVVVACIEILVIIFTCCLRRAILDEDDEPY